MMVEPTDFRHRECSTAISDAQVPYPLPEGCTVNAVQIAEEVLGGFVPGECFHHVPSRPLRGGKLGNIGRHDPSPFMRNDFAISIKSDEEPGCADVVCAWEPLKTLQIMLLRHRNCLSHPVA